MTDSEDRKPDDEQRPPTLWQTIGSVLAAFFGVQGSAARERDFTRGRPLHFILIGVAATAAFVLTLIVIVRLILAQAGG